ncbi:hypothetical protein LMG28614_06339 [Paraburkholderia ultramafica]|uniref:Uncharacterized protein n=1 Tax=Paraburkholderia ultramafica TaxID=1544867 RepID=A0A6S7BP75_9BURK|nr:hypothetical protein [Paraburkholderia ultramafica]CAB3806224.1 hypothetical protein LMG28614_06339 [Paraburkholderia ultramafica]
MTIGRRSRNGLNGVLHVLTTAIGETLAPAFGGTDQADVGEACDLAEAQNVPDALLPEPLQQRNPLGIWRLRDGQFVKP